MQDIAKKESSNNVKIEDSKNGSYYISKKKISSA